MMIDWGSVIVGLTIGIPFFIWMIYSINEEEKERKDGHIRSHGVQGDLGWVHETMLRDFDRQPIVRKHDMDKKMG